MLRRRFLAAILSLASILLSTNLAAAGPIVQYELFGAPGNQVSSPASFTAPGITGLPITRGAGLNVETGANSLNSASWNSLSADEFVQLGFNVTSGGPYFIDQFFLASRSSGTGPGFVNVNVSIDGGAFFTLTTLTQGNATFLNSVLNINQTVNSSLVVQFRAANNTSANGGTIASAGTWRIGDYSPDNGQTFAPISLNGQAVAAVPEPSALVCCGVGLACLAGARLRRQFKRGPSIND